VLEHTGAARRGTSIELYLEPGVQHCSGGDGPDRFDAVIALEQWVRSGRAPARIVASHVSGRTVDRTRPLCPYPLVAAYLGSGSIDRAENFRCASDPAIDVLEPRAPVITHGAPLASRQQTTTHHTPR